MRAQQSLSTVSGRIIRLGDDVNTDLIYPGKYVPLVDPDQWAAHALEGIDPGFPARIQQNDIIVAGKNFGCGSSRSQAVSCLKAAGIGAIVAGSLARIFFRNCINQGLPVVVCPEAVRIPGDEIEIDFETSQVSGGKMEFSFDPQPDFLMDILRVGGLKPYTRQRLVSMGWGRSSG